MGVVHSLDALAEGAVLGMQASQRDWSPFIAHFTSWSAMKAVGRAVVDGKNPQEIRNLLADADGKSFGIMTLISASGKLMANSPSPSDNVPECVCFSECTLPGLLSLCERYGRFGFVFEKSKLYESGARPCAYLGRDEYHIVARHGRNASVGTSERRLFGLSNVYSPPGAGHIQDFTHDREWRYFGNLELMDITPIMYICPVNYLAGMRKLFGGDPIYIPIDLMFRWGA